MPVTLPPPVHSMPGVDPGERHKGRSASSGRREVSEQNTKALALRHREGENHPVIFIAEPEAAGAVYAPLRRSTMPRGTIVDIYV